MIEAVTYDFWETIAREAQESLMERRTTAWTGLLAASDVAPERVRAAFEEAWRTHAGHWRAGRQFGPARAAEFAVEQLGVHVSPALRDELVEAFADAGATAELIVNDGLAEALDALRQRGIRIGIVCDVGFTSGELLRGFLERRDLLRRFDGWAFSDEVGVYKPDPAIFAHALEQLGGVEPAAALHVGDLRRTDVAGARAFGMTSVRYRGANDDDEDLPEADHVIDHHAELPALVGQPM
ncbi:MAG: putative hydrolase of the superfamily [Solirubrobacteraceae bacterium]|nr:putative hydrolase of the superfamily [Solirubrobacteraceae bacterium]